LAGYLTGKRNEKSSLTINLRKGSNLLLTLVGYIRKRAAISDQSAPKIHRFVIVHRRDADERAERKKHSSIVTLTDNHNPVVEKDGETDRRICGISNLPTIKIMRKSRTD